MIRPRALLTYSSRALKLVWTTHRPMSLCLILLTVVAGIAPAGIAYVASRIVDTIVNALREPQPAREALSSTALSLVAMEAFLVALVAATQRGLSLCQSLLRARLGQRVQELIIEKALTLDLAHFENAEFYDKLTRAQQGALSRPLSFVMRTFASAQNAISLLSFAGLLASFSPYACLILIAAGLPAFLADAKFSGEAFRLFLWRSPEARMQSYLTGLLTRDDPAKEIRVFRLGALFLERHRAIFRKVYRADGKLAIRRDTWGVLLGLIGTAAVYSTYAWIALAAIAARITVGQMTMYFALFRQGQATVGALLAGVNSLYEDHLYLSTLHDFLETPVTSSRGKAITGPLPGDGIRFESVSFEYSGTKRRVLEDVSLHIRPSRSLALVGENGSGKTTLIKLLSRLYTPTAGRILLDGLDLREWDETVLRERIGVIFQDFARYQLRFGENIGAGDVEHFDDESRWRVAGEQGMASAIAEGLPRGYHTQLGRWFAGGQELSGGQWQKIALSRAFMRTRADILVLDEPTSAMDAAAEAQIFERFHALTTGRIAILISHRFSTVRMADEIVVLRGGRIIERGSHEQLVRENGLYQNLFSLQAAGYQ